MKPVESRNTVAEVSAASPTAAPSTVLRLAPATRSEAKSAIRWRRDSSIWHAVPTSPIATGGVRQITVSTVLSRSA